MVKNNIKSFLIHLIISFIFVRIFMIFNSNEIKWVSEAAATSHYVFTIFNIVIRIALAVGLYYLLARNFLRNQGSLYRNILSTSLTAIVGLFLWIIALSNGGPAEGKHLLDLDQWEILRNYIGYSLMFFNETHINNLYVYLIFIFIPTTVMALSIEKRSEEKIFY